MPRILVHTVAMPTARDRHVRLGYALAASAATMWALNGSLSSLLLDDGVSAMRLAELRAVLTFALLAAAVAISRPALLRVRREDIPRLAFLGVAGLAGVHVTYFFAISRLDVGVALVIQYLGPLILLLWLRLAHRRRLKSSLWGAAALSVIGCALVVQIWNPGAIDVLGLLGAFGSAITFALYLYTSEQAGHRYEPVTTLVWGFGFASLLWLVVQPIWTFPFDKFASAENIALGLGVVIVGTALPFVCIVAALRHVPASRAAVVATLEPVLAAIIAWPVLGQDLDVAQIAGGLIVVGAVIWVQVQRPAHEDEAAPAYGARRRESAAAAVR
jgi:drug/metabolite transporter (DMT)-like permease